MLIHGVCADMEFFLGKSNFSNQSEKTQTQQTRDARIS